MGVRLTTKHRIWDARGPYQTIRSKHNEAGFSTILIDLLCLRVAQMPRSPDLAIFVLTTDTQTDCFTPATHAGTRDNYCRFIIRIKAHQYCKK
jgi:hypothetical protein